MNQVKIGQFICQMRKEKNITQEQLSEKLGVSNKTVSKWETGKCMPDYSVIKPLCDELEISVSELIDAERNGEKNVRTYDEEQILDLLRRTSELEKQRNMIMGMLVMVMGFALQGTSRTIGGSSFKDFISGLLLGLSIGAVFTGVYLIARNSSKK